MTPCDLQAGGAERGGSQHVLLLAQRQQLRTCQAADVDPADQADRQDDVDQTRAADRIRAAPDRNQKQRKQPDRHRGEDLDEAHDDVVEPSAKRSSQRTECQSDAQCHRLDRETDGQRHARTVDDAAEKVAPHAVGAEQVASVGKLVGIHQDRKVVARGRKQVGEDRHRGEDRYNRQRSDRQLVARKAAHRVAPQG